MVLYILERVVIMTKAVEMVATWMKDKEVSKVELADQMGVSEALVRAMLSGDRRITANRIDSLSQITGISVSTLLGTPENDFAGYTVMLRGGSKQLNAKQESLVMDVALLANEYERLKAFIR